MSTLTRAAALAAATGLLAGATIAVGQPATAVAPKPRSAHTVSVVEGDQASVTVKLTKRAKHRVRLRWRTRDRTARAGSDYAAVRRGHVVFHRGEKRATVMVSTLDDAVVEGREHFVVKVRGKAGIAKPKHAKVRVVIADDDGGSGLTPPTTGPTPGPPPSL